MIRYRYDAGSTSRAKKKFHQVAKVGKILSVRGYRYRVWVGGNTGYSGVFERVIVKGENGTARFGGVCWGYSGEGPRGLIDLLKLCGVSPNLAEAVAYHAPRNDRMGTDWELNFSAEGIVLTQFFENHPVRLAVAS